MAITNLELAILAMDAYNRDGDRLALSTAEGVGSFILGASVGGGTAFYAQAYSNGSETVISYRGTDDPTDIGTGWPQGFGFLTPQAAAAAGFYQQVAGDVIGDTNIILTGHSLGGGLAGFVGSIYGVTSVGFDNMPFELSATNLYNAALKNPSDVDNRYYQGAPPQQLDGSGVSAFAVAGEVLHVFRSLQNTPVQSIKPHGSRNSIDLHSQPLLVTLLWAQEVGHTAWHPIGDQLLTSFFDESIGDAAGSDMISSGYNDTTYEMQASIAYSALDSGTRPFGDSAIRALFNDADALGRMYERESINSLLETEAVKEALVDIVVQYAADLAAQESTDKDDKSGVVLVSQSDNLLFVDLDPETWVNTYQETENIVAQTALIEALLEDAGVPIDKWDGAPEDVTRVLAATNDQGANLNGENAPDADSGDPGGTVLVGGGGDDQLTGADGSDVLVGGDGEDMLRGGDGNDILVGGDGNDILIAEGQTETADEGDTLVGGDGADQFIIWSMTAPGEERLEITIEDASVDDRLFVAWDFFSDAFTPATAEIDPESSSLFPLLGGFADYLYVDDGNIDQIVAGAFEWHERPDPDEEFECVDDDVSVGQYFSFYGDIFYHLEGADLLIYMSRADTETETEECDDVGNTREITFLAGILETETIIRVVDFQEGDLGIEFHDLMETDEGDFPGWDTALDAITNLGQFDSPIGSFDDALDVDSVEDESDANGSPSQVAPTTTGTSNDDVIAGDATAEYIFADSGNDTITAEGGNDYIDPGSGANTVDGGSGVDTVTFENATPVGVGITVDLEDEGQGGQGTTSNGGSLTNIENVVGTGFNDDITGDELANSLYGRSGSDDLAGLGGNDTLKGEDGDDTISGGAGDDYIDGGEGTDTALFGGNRSDYDISRLSDGSLIVRDLRGSSTAAAQSNIIQLNAATTSSDDGTDDLLNIEFLQFADVTVSEFEAANHDPESGGDPVFTIEPNTNLSLSSTDLLATASDVDGDTLSIASVQDPLNGTVALDANGTITFTPTTNFVGAAVFSYTISDGNGGETTGRVQTIVNTAPNANDDGGFVTISNTPITIATATLLANDSEPDGQEIEIVGIESAENGVAQFDGSGDVVFTPTAGFSGLASFTYALSDPFGVSSFATVSIDVQSTNDAPIVTGPAILDVTEDVISAGAIIASDPNGDPLSYAIKPGEEPSLGAVTLQPDGSFTYQPDANANGSDGFTVVVSDGQGGSAEQTIAVTVTPVNDAPVIGVVPDLSGTEDTAFTATLAATLFTDVDGDALTVGVRSGDGSALPTWLAFDAVTRTLSGTPPQDFNGPVALEVTLSDGVIEVAKPLSLTIAAVNDAPTVSGLGDLAGTEDTAFTATLPEAAFADVDGDVLTTSVALGNGDPLPTWLGYDAVTRTLTGTPPQDFNGTLDLVVTVSDGALSATQAIQFVIDPVNDAPVIGVVPDLSGTEDTAFTATLAANLFTDVDGDALTVGVRSGDGSALPTWLSFDALTRTLSGTPPQDFNGPVALEVTLSDGVIEVTKPLSLTIAAVNDAPTVSGLADLAGTEDTAFTATLPEAAFADVDGDVLTTSVALGNGDPLPTWLGYDAVTRTLSGTPPQDFNGTLDLVVTVSDGALSATQAIQFVIDAVNDAPVIGVVPDLSGTEDTAFTATLAATLFTDVDGDALTVGVRAGDGSALPTWLAFDAVTRTLSGTPPQDFNGPVALEVTLSDGVIEVTKPLSLTIAAVNDAPTVSGLSDLAGTEDTFFSATLPEAAFADVDGDVLTTSVALGNGDPLPTWLGYDAVTRTLSGTPPQDFNGTLDLVVTVSDGALSASQAIQFVIDPVNDAPVIGVVPDLSGTEDRAFTATLAQNLFTDVDGDALTVGVRSGDGSALPTWLSFDAVTRTLSGTPPQNFNGPVALEVTLSDGTVEVTKPLSLTIAAMNDAPVARNDLVDGVEDQALLIPLASLLANDSDVDGDTLVVTSISDGGGFTTALDGSGNIIFTPDENVSGDVSFDYTVSDGTLTDTGSVSVSILPVNDVPVVQGIADHHSDEDATIDFVLPADVASDVDGDTLTLTASRPGGTALPSWLSFDAATRRFTGTPPQNFFGTIAILLTADDGTATAASEFELVIDPVNDAPTLSAPFSDRFISEDESFTVALQSGLVTDVDGDPLTFDVRSEDGSALPSWASFDAAAFALTGTPPANFSGTVPLRVFISDGTTEISDDFDLIVVADNDAPVLDLPLPDVDSDSAGNTLVTGAVFSIPIPPETFSDPDGDALQFAATLANDDLLPDWISFNGSQLTGVAPHDAVGAWDITIRASDGLLEASDTFSVTFEEGNFAPVAVDDGPYETRGDVALNISANALLSNDSDPEGDALQLTSVSGASNGTVAINNNGNVTYTPDTGFTGNDQFIYEISDGTNTAQAVVRVGVGAPYDDTQTGTGGDDVLIGGNGDSNLSGGGGDDILLSGSGDDLLRGGRGDDLLFAGSGDDILRGGAGNDLLFGASGADNLAGGVGSDILFGGRGDDRIAGGSGADVIFGGRGDDRILGGLGDDVLFGGAGSDIFIFGEGSGSDQILDYQTPRSGRNFNIGGDRIRLSFDGVNNFDDLLTLGQEQDGGILFDFGDGDEIFLAGTQLSALDRDSFTFF